MRDWKGSVVTWAEVWPWLEQVAEYGVQPRVVVVMEDKAHARVVVTCRRRDEGGFWKEVIRDGELVTTAKPDNVQLAAIRVCGRLLYDLELRSSGPAPLPDYVVQLPLPNME